MSPTHIWNKTKSHMAKINENMCVYNGYAIKELVKILNKVLSP